MNRDTYKVGDRGYYMRRVIEVLSVFSTFHLVKIKFLDDDTETYVDCCTIDNEPDFSNSISLQWLRR